MGLQYSSEEDCRYSGAPTFLVFGGGIVLTTTTLNIVAYLTPCGWDDKITDAIITPMAHLINMIVLVWGSISIFSNYPMNETYAVLIKFGLFSYILGAYQYVTHTEKESEFYCAPTPFKFAFVFLVLAWTIFPFLLCCGLCICCGLILYLIFPTEEDVEEPEPIFPKSTK